MKEFEIVCPLSREPRLKEIEAKACGRPYELLSLIHISEPTRPY